MSNYSDSYPEPPFNFPGRFEGGHIYFGHYPLSELPSLKKDWGEDNLKDQGGCKTEYKCDVSELADRHVISVSEKAFIDFLIKPRSRGNQGSKNKGKGEVKKKVKEKKKEKKSQTEIPNPVDENTIVVVKKDVVVTIVKEMKGFNLKTREPSLFHVGTFWMYLVRYKDLLWLVVENNGQYIGQSLESWKMTVAGNFGKDLCKIDGLDDLPT